ncbi:MAG: DUF362 domain-containing protein [candidate division WOR-3 bacterium]|nr:DUF362 domain-containing protein [candidate division WOR-3 bacterium]
MKSTVYYIPVNKINAVSINQAVVNTNFIFQLINAKNIGIKVHFGEAGNNNYLEPKYVKMFVDLVKAKGKNPTLIETSTLYRGQRQNRISHIKIAYEHGFNENNVGAPIAILDGERGEAFEEIEVSLNYIRNAKIARGLRDYDTLINLAHFKGHFVVGFGGVIKNIAMGLSAKGGKLEMHSQTKPFVKLDKCNKCETCVSVCPTDAIIISDKGAEISSTCVGCASCVEVCPENAIKINWNESSELTQKKMAEYAWAILKNRVSLHCNFALKITPNCDCMDRTEKPILSDIGLFISLDPVACDQAVWDRTKNKINELYSEINPEILLAYCEQLGLGNRQYEICEIQQ